MAKNLCKKMRPVNDPYEIWKSRDGSWTWHVLSKSHADDGRIHSKNPYVRWFCNVVTPFVPQGEMGDVYASDIKRYGYRVK